MPERQGPRRPLTAIHIDLKERSIALQAEGQTLAKLTLAPEGVLFEAPPAGTPAAEPQQITATHQPPADLLPEAAVPTDAAPSKERLTTLTGKLKTKPKEGRADRQGNPTAYARLAVHRDGDRDAQMLLATFHRHTAPIALGLPRDAQITVTGYAHPSASPGRLGTFSVINLVSYPGKADRNA